MVGSSQLGDHHFGLALSYLDGQYHIIIPIRSAFLMAFMNILLSQSINCSLVSLSSLQSRNKRYAAGQISMFPENTTIPKMIVVGCRITKLRILHGSKTARQILIPFFPICLGVYYNGLLLSEISAGLTYLPFIHVTKYANVEYVENFEASISSMSPFGRYSLYSF